MSLLSRQPRLAVQLIATLSALPPVATSFETSQPPLVDCEGTDRSGSLPCDLMFGLNVTKNNSDPMRLLVKNLGDAVDGRTCSVYISQSNSIWNRDFTTFWDTAADAPLAGSDGTVVGCASSTCYGCFCYKQGFEAFTKDTNGLRSYCRDYWCARRIINIHPRHWSSLTAGEQPPSRTLLSSRATRRSNFALSWTLKGLSIISVLLINQLLVTVMDKLTVFERLHSRSAMELSKGVKLFLAQFINTLVVTLAVRPQGPSARVRPTTRSLHANQPDLLHAGPR